MSQYNIKIQHPGGKTHGNADGLSRIPAMKPPCDYYEAGKDVSELPCGGCKLSPIHRISGKKIYLFIVMILVLFCTLVFCLFVREFLPYGDNARKSYDHASNTP